MSESATPYGQAAAARPRYVVLVSCFPDTLQGEVNAAIEQGYEPIGGVSVASVFEHWENHDGRHLNTLYTYAQAMLLK